VRGGARGRGGGGFKPATHPPSHTSLCFAADVSSGLIDYDALARSAALYRPKLLVCGASAYSRLIDYGRLRTVADAHDALLLCDMAVRGGGGEGGGLLDVSLAPPL
jgi:hypothetical protein